MNKKRLVAAREKVLSQLPDLSLVLRGSLFERTVRHTSGCRTCKRGEGHPLWVLNVIYPGGGTRQVSLRPEQAQQAREWIANYHRAKQLLEQISELNQALLRDQRQALKRQERSK
jgi:uncharacterized protein DUF6788